MKHCFTNRLLLSFALMMTALGLPTYAAGTASWFTDPPIELTVRATDAGAVTLSWTDPSANETGFQIERKVGRTGTFQPLASVGANVTRYTDAGLLANTFYYYRVRAVGGTAPTGYSAEVRFADTHIPQAVKVQRDGTQPKVPFGPEYAYTALANGSEYNVFPAPYCLDGTYYVGWQLYYDLGNANTATDWTAYLEVSLVQGGTVLWTKPLQADMGTQTFVATIFHDQPIACNQNYYFRIGQKTETGTVPTGHLRLKQLYHRQHDGAFDPNATLTMSYVLNAPNAQVTWNYEGRNAVAYDLEWVYLADHENITAPGARQAFAAKEPVRITTATNGYTHPMYYPAGKVGFRVRAVGYNPAWPEHRINGVWHYGSGTLLPVTNPQADMNWQLQTSFAEDGKYKKLMNYYDGSLRLRQTLTNLSADERTLVAESFYDFEGRKAVDVLPAPVAGSSLVYKSSLNTFTTTNPVIGQHTSASRRKFHYDNTTLENSVLATTNGTAQYYSAANPLAMLNKDYLPAANGYVYTQTEYTRDNTGRVTRQSGVGETFKMDGNRATRMYYGSAAPAELIRLFGSNVGNAAHYKKNLTVDPNGQVSVTYLDQEGRTIATALAGEKPANLEALPSYTQLGNDPITVDISGKNQRQAGISGNTHKIMNVNPNTSYQFAYTLSALASQIQNMGCQTCAFHLKITITDPDGKPLNLSSVPGNESEDGLAYEKKNLTAASCSSAQGLSNLSFAVTFAEIGDYTIVKELTARELTFEEARTELLRNETVQQKITQIRNSYPQDPSQCEICQTEACAGEDGVNRVAVAIGEIADADCENILATIRAGYQPAPGGPDDAPELYITSHPDYCKYLLCVQDKESDVFEKQMSLVQTWSAAVTKGYNQLLDRDPFFNRAGLSGNGHKAAMQTALADIHVATIGTRAYRGTILAVTDPANTAFYVDDSGNPNPATGFHLLYSDLMKKRSTMTPEAYARQLDEQRWTLYRSFYQRAKRQIRRQLPPYQACPSALAELDQIAGLPQTEQGILQFGRDNYVLAPVTNEELGNTVALLSSKCNMTLSEADRTAITGHLRTYFNGNQENFFRLVLTEDRPANPQLAAIQGILAGYNCGLDSIAVPNPVRCIREETIVIPAEAPCTNCPNSVSGEQPTLAPGEAALDERDNLLAEREKLIEEQIQQMHRQLEADLMQQALARPNNQKGLAIQAGDNAPVRVQTAQPSRAEYDALIALYQATNGANWTNNTGWRNAVPGVVQDVSGWYGVTVDATGRVTRIFLYNNQLSGTIPPQLSNLTALQRLNLGNNKQISGPIPGELGSLTQLLALKANNGTVNWNDNNYKKLGPLGERLGFEWGGRWKFVDKPHFQRTFNFSTSELRNRVENGDTTTSNGNTYPNVRTP